MTDTPERGTEGASPGEITPRGTIFVMMVYIIILAGMWGVLYWTMLSR